MTATAELDRILEGFSKRIYTLEQTVSSPGNFGSTNEFDEIVLDDPDDDEDPIVIVPQAPDTPLNVAVAPGSHFDVIYSDVEWDAAPAGEAALIYEVEVAEKIAGVYQIGQVFRTSGTNFRVQPLEPSKTYGVRVTAMSRIGRFSDPTAWVDFNSGTDNTVPAQITGVTIGRGATSAVVTFTPSTALDVIGTKGLYEIQIDTVNTFNSANLKVQRTTSWVVAFQGIQTELNYYARVSAIDSSGNQGPWSAVAGPSVVGGVIDSMVVAGLDAAKITFGTMDGDRIAANSASIGILETSSLTSADITLAGGSFKAGSPPTTGLLINSQGIRLYQSGTQTITLDAATGAATFRGNMTAGTIQIGSNFSVDASGNVVAGSFQTASSGARIAITGSEKYRIKFIAADGSTQGTIGTQDGSTNDPMIYQAGDGNHFFRDMAGSEVDARIYVGGITFNDFISQTGGTANLRDLDVWSLDSSGFVDGTSFRISGSTVIDSSRNADFNSLDVGSGDFTVSSAGAVDAAANITTGDKFFTLGAATASTVPSAQVLSSGEIRKTTHANSSLRYKENLRVIGDGEVNWKGLMKLRPSRYDLREGILTNDEERYDQYGLVAEEVIKVLPEVVQLDEEGRPDLVDYSKLSVFLLMWNQKLQREVDALKKAA